MGEHPIASELVEDLERPVYSPSYAFRDGEEPLAYQIFCSDESSEVIHEYCAKTPSDREFPLYADDVEALTALSLEPVICLVCDCNIPLPHGR